MLAPGPTGRADAPGLSGKGWGDKEIQEVNTTVPWGFGQEGGERAQSLSPLTFPFQHTHTLSLSPSPSPSLSLRGFLELTSVRKRANRLPSSPPMGSWWWARRWGGWVDLCRCLGMLGGHVCRGRHDPSRTFFHMWPTGTAGVSTEVVPYDLEREPPWWPWQKGA